MSRSLNRWGVAFGLATVLFAAAPSAHAQSNSGSGFFAATAAAIGVSTFTSATSPIVTTLGGGATALIIVLNAAGDAASKEAYVRNNALALRQELTLGGGETLEDLAAAFRVDRRDFDEFAGMLHERRETLLPLTDLERLDQGRADRFFRAIVEGMRAHPTLRKDLAETAFAAARGR